MKIKTEYLWSIILLMKSVNFSKVPRSDFTGHQHYEKKGSTLFRIQSLMCSTCFWIASTQGRPGFKFCYWCCLEHISHKPCQEPSLPFLNYFPQPLCGLKFLTSTFFRQGVLNFIYFEFGVCALRAITKGWSQFIDPRCLCLAPRCPDLRLATLVD